MKEPEMPSPADDGPNANHTGGTTTVADDVALVRMFVTTYTVNRVGEDAPRQSRLLALDALERLEAAAGGTA